MATFQEVLQNLRGHSTISRERGTLFEQLMLSYLKHDPVQNFRDVWTWKNWPKRETLMKRDGRDLGIDLVAQDEEGNYHAVQCKFYDEDTKIQRSDIDSFLVDSARPEIFKTRLLAHTANDISENIDKVVKNQEPAFSKLGPDELSKAQFDWNIIDPTKSKPRPRQYALREHQLEALKKTMNGFKASDRGKVIMACGTGKTLLALHIAEKQAPKAGHVLVLVPSIALISQTLSEWAWQRHRDHRYFAICSDQKVGKDEDMKVEDLVIPATTNSRNFYECIKQSSKKLTVVFSTYQSIEKVHDAQHMGAPEFDLVICDEAHRTTGVDLSDKLKSTGTFFTKIHHHDYIKCKKTPLYDRHPKSLYR